MPQSALDTNGMSPQHHGEDGLGSTAATPPRGGADDSHDCHRSGTQGFDPPPDATAGSIAVSVIMPTVSWTGTFAACGRRIVEVLERSSRKTEFIVVFDGAAPPTPQWLARSGATVLSTDRRSGPAFARNMAANAAGGRVLFFVDADVELHFDAIDRVAAAFDADEDLSAVFGAYDDEPAAEGVVSQFRNLLHHHTHVAHSGAAATFWSGCGAVRTGMFLDVDGFDESYLFPSVEDIELGMRIRAKGGRIVLDPDLRCKHLKQWTLPGMLVADIFHRAMPWTHLIMSTQRLPATLNIDWKGRLSGVLSVLLMVCLPVVVFVPSAVWLALAAAAGLVLTNFSFYSLCLRKRGLAFAAWSFALHSLFFVYSTITFGVVVLQQLFSRFRGSAACPHRPSISNAPHPAISRAVLAPRGSR